MNHKIKVLSCYFEAIIVGKKLFEIRDNSDRGYNAGDTIAFFETDEDGHCVRAMATGDPVGSRTIQAEITYVTNYHQAPDWVVFGFRVITAPAGTKVKA